MNKRVLYILLFLGFVALGLQAQENSVPLSDGADKSDTSDFQHSTFNSQPDTTFNSQHSIFNTQFSNYKERRKILRLYKRIRSS